MTQSVVEDIIYTKHAHVTVVDQVEGSTILNGYVTQYTKYLTLSPPSKGRVGEDTFATAAVTNSLLSR